MEKMLFRGLSPQLDRIKRRDETNSISIIWNRSHINFFAEVIHLLSVIYCQSLNFLWFENLDRRTRIHQNQS